MVFIVSWSGKANPLVKSWDGCNKHLGTRELLWGQTSLMSERFHVYPYLVRISFESIGVDCHLMFSLGYEGEFAARESMVYGGGNAAQERYGNASGQYVGGY
ncbi:hypothetical protein Tco_1071828 [Tanacetum coccineum]